MALNKPFLASLKNSKFCGKSILFGLSGKIPFSTNLSNIIPVIIAITSDKNIKGKIRATILEVCSEGSTPVAADILTRAKAPGNSFAFLMTGVSTDYTEIMILKDTTKSWKIALFLPLLW